MRGTIPVESLPGGIDLRTTLESGQSYLWERDGETAYGTDAGQEEDAWYYTVLNGDVVRVRHRPTRDVLAWEATTDATDLLMELLGLEDDLHDIRATVPEDTILQQAWDHSFGLRIVSDPFFPSLISFICSAQMRVERIHRMQRALREQYGERVSFMGQSYYGFPSPATLAAATEAELRDLGLGYRAPYVVETSRLIADGEITKADVSARPYEDARERLTDLVGVGPKVADCVCLFSLSFLQAVPLDTWMQTAIDRYYPDCAGDSYAETSRALRSALGGTYAGYTQTYLFEYLRTGQDKS